MAKIDPSAYEHGLERLTAILARMVLRAEELSTRRCPYRDRRDRCTAGFGCRNQRRDAAERRVCAGDHLLSY